MPLTVTAAQARLAQRLGEYAGLVDLVDLLAVGLRSLGVSPLDLDMLIDDDLETIQASQIDQLYDVAQAEGLERILLNLEPVALLRIGITEDPATIAARLRPLLVSLRLRIDQRYGVNLQEMKGGILTYDFQQRGDETCLGEF